MKIQSIDNSNFEARVKTLHVFEITTQKVFEPDGFIGMTKTMRKLYPMPARTGMNGYMKYAGIIGRKITEKYAQIAQKSTQLKLYILQNPNASTTDIQTYARSLASKFGEEIDIII